LVDLKCSITGLTETWWIISIRITLLDLQKRKDCLDVFMNVSSTSEDLKWLLWLNIYIANLMMYRV